MRKIKEELKQAFLDFDPETEINIFGFGQDMIEMDVISDKWELMSISNRIHAAIEIIENKGPKIVKKFALCVCPVTRAEFADRTERPLHG